MKVLVDNRTNEELQKEYIDLIENVCKESLDYEDFDSECEISISIVDNKEIAKINKQFRDIDDYTDVLSFPQLTFEEGEFADENENGEIILGDIIISIEKAREQAKDYGHSLKREIGFLTAHSMLHLLGYDHMDDLEESEMFDKQTDILEKMGLSRGC